MQLPLLFSFQQPVFGNGFLAGVRMNGRALLEEGDEIWIVGVAPAGFSAGGPDRGAAFSAFKNAWATVLFDIAAESRSFEAFKSACDEFLSAASPSLSQEWQDALEQVRREKYVDTTLKCEPGEQAVSFEVIELTTQQLNPADNVLEVCMQAAA